MREKFCHNCKYYKVSEHGDFEDGHCHLNPPVVTGSIGVSHDGKQKFFRNTYWPFVRGDEFCGKHEGPEEFIDPDLEDALAEVMKQ